MKRIFRQMRYTKGKIFFSLKSFGLLVRRMLWRLFLCRFGFHLWVSVSKRKIGLCDCCGRFYELGLNNKVVCVVDKGLSRKVRRRMEKGLCR